MDEKFIGTSCKCLTTYSLYTKWPNERKCSLHPSNKNIGLSFFSTVLDATDSMPYLVQSDRKPVTLQRTVFKPLPVLR